MIPIVWHWGKQFRIHDSSRFRKKAGDAKLRFSARGCLCHPSCLLWFHVFWRTFEAAGCVPSVMSQPQKQDCHTLQRVDLARPFLVSPAIKIEIENSLEMALSKAKSGSAWQSHFWQCGTLRPARNTKLLHYASKSKLGFVQAASFNATVQHVDVCVILPAFCGFMFSGELLKQLGAFRASCRNPKNRIATRSNAWIWRARFWSRLLLK